MCGFCGVTRREYIFGDDNIYVYVYVRAWNWLNSSSIARRSITFKCIFVTDDVRRTPERKRERKKVRAYKYIFFSQRGKTPVWSLSINMSDNFDAWNKSLLRFNSSLTKNFQCRKQLSGVKTLRIFAEEYSESRIYQKFLLKKKRQEAKKNKAPKCTSDFARTCDGDVVGRTDSHYGICSRVRFWTRRGSRFTILRIRHVEKAEKDFSWRNGTTSATPRSQSPPLGRRFTFVWFLLSEVSIFP